jgi:hypothetical protein
MHFFVEFIDNEKLEEDDVIDDDDVYTLHV